MEILKPDQIAKAVDRLREGKVIAYPTEAVFGLGCDPGNIDAIIKILQIKHRAIRKGFILIGSSWEQLEPLVNFVRPDQLTRAFETWPGPVTWLFPAADHVPHWICGEHTSVAIRVVEHPVAKAICEAFGGPIISTSCNKSGDPPARNLRTIELTLKDTVDCVIDGAIGGRMKPSEIRDVLTGEVIRG